MMSSGESGAGEEASEGVDVCGEEREGGWEVVDLSMLEEGYG